MIPPREEGREKGEAGPEPWKHLTFNGQAGREHWVWRSEAEQSEDQDPWGNAVSDATGEQLPDGVCGHQCCEVMLRSRRGLRNAH